MAGSRSTFQEQGDFSDCSTTVAPIYSDAVAVGEGVFHTFTTRFDSTMKKSSTNPRRGPRPGLGYARGGFEPPRYRIWVVRTKKGVAALYGLNSCVPFYHFQYDSTSPVAFQSR